MDTRIWGPHAWMFMHTVSFHYPIQPTEQDKIDIANFFHAMAAVLPCSICKTHFTKLLKEHPIENALDSRNSLTQWVVNAHNMVNRRLGKQELNHDVIKRDYEMIRGKTCEANASLANTIEEKCLPLTEIQEKTKFGCQNGNTAAIVLGTLLGLVILGIMISAIVCKLCQHKSAKLTT